MDRIDGWWAGAQDHAYGVDLMALAGRAGGWPALIDGGVEALVSLGVAWPAARAWTSTPERWTRGAALTLADPRYPARLRDTPDPPPVVCVEGEVAALCGPAVAVVGTRECTRYGRVVAREVAERLGAAGVAVVSGLARGIDAEAHRGAMSTGRTVAVLGHGLDHTAPASNRALRDGLVAAGGAVISGYPDGLPPRPHTFPPRNAWIVGLSQAVVVVEAGVRSGALISARHALAAGRDVYAVPGPIDAPASQGCLRLLDDGACVVVSVGDLVRRLVGAAASSAPATLAELLLSGRPLDEVARARGATVAGVLAEATMLELRGELRRIDERRWVRPALFDAPSGPR